METTNNKYYTLFEQLKRLATLYLDDIRLTAAEKLTILLSAIAVFAIVMIFVSLFVVFAAMAVAHLLESVAAPFWAYMMVAFFFLIIAVLFFAYRTEIIVNPVARFLSRLFVAPPVTPGANPQADTSSSPTTNTDQEP